MIVKMLGRVDYLGTYKAMRNFTDARVAGTPDELWVCEHPAVYTQGLAGKPEHVLGAGDIPVVHSNRGGQVTFHGPGQIVAYPLVNLQRLGIYVKEYVYRLEQALLKTLADVGITGHRVRGAPGIYVRLSDPSGHGRLVLPALDPAAPGLQFVGLGKIAALGIKVSRQCGYHGVALNVAMDLSAFDRINPCGYPGLTTVDLRSLGVTVPVDEVAQALTEHLQHYVCRLP